jgi:isochorismate pyruvate lyase
MKRPVECTNIEEIRNGIDDIDKQIIELLGKRLQYVTEIVRFKKDEEDVIAKQRYSEVLLARRELAVKASLDPDVIENMYKHLIGYFIEVQMKTLNEKIG